MSGESGAMLTQETANDLQDALVQKMIEMGSQLTEDDAGEVRRRTSCDGIGGRAVRLRVRVIPGRYVASEDKKRTANGVELDFPADDWPEGGRPLPVELQALVDDTAKQLREAAALTLALRLGAGSWPPLVTIAVYQQADLKIEGTTACVTTHFKFRVPKT